MKHGLDIIVNDHQKRLIQDIEIIFHYKWNRVPTVRENARLQSFPDRFEFLGTKTQQNRQVGNAVPPLLAQAIAGGNKKYLDSIKLTK